MKLPIIMVWNNQTMRHEITDDDIGRSLNVELASSAADEWLGMNTTIQFHPYLFTVNKRIFPGIYFPDFMQTYQQN
ncbi:MAG: hypothetical protein E6Q97_30395 [Desulfurellales bacterium]|nr:MAG: hypothetical protein E6Q97_30395 [Desulfurellales bacterium]